MSTDPTQIFEGETRDVDRNYGFIDYQGNDGRRRTVFYSSRNITPDWRGSRAWAFGPCVPVSFRIVRGGTKAQVDKKHAEDVVTIFPMSEPEDLAGYRETSEVVSKKYDYCFLKRPCGDALFIHVEDVIEQHKDRWSFLEIGSPVYHGVRFDEGTQRWRADYVELYSYHELMSFKEPVLEQLEPEPVLVVATPKLEPVPEVLAPENRSKTFLQLAQEALEKRVRHEFPKKDQGQ
jgi:hypothetical protein